MAIDHQVAPEPKHTYQRHLGEGRARVVDVCMRMCAHVVCACARTHAYKYVCMGTWAMVEVSPMKAPNAAARLAPMEKESMTLPS